MVAEWDIGSSPEEDGAGIPMQEGSDSILAEAGAADNLAEAEHMADSPAGGKAGILSGESGESEECLAGMAVGIPVLLVAIGILSQAPSVLAAGLAVAAMMAEVCGDSLELGVADIL